VSQAKSGGFVRPHGAGCSIKIEVSPGAKKTEIIGINPWRGALQVKVAAEPREGAANDELLAFLGKKLGLDRTEIRFLKGERSSKKTLFIPMPPDKVESMLGGD
jgi:uncharacterized protein (TIGR00251 family)